MIHNQSSTATNPNFRIRSITCSMIIIKLLNRKGLQFLLVSDIYSPETIQCVPTMKRSNCFITKFVL